MSEARAQIFNAIRKNLKRGPLQGERRAALEARLTQPQNNLIPARAQLPHAEQVALFVAMAQEAAATVEQVAGLAAVPAAVSRYIEQQGLQPAEIVLAPDGELAGLPWQAQADLVIQRRQVKNGDRIGLTLAFAGIAETGTLMLLSGPGNPTVLNFLPDINIVVLLAERVAGPYEDAWAWLREYGGGMPRTVNFITGPSRSADIEQTLQLGAHGPVQVHVVLVQP